MIITAIIITHSPDQLRPHIPFAPARVHRSGVSRNLVHSVIRGGGTLDQLYTNFSQLRQSWHLEEGRLVVK